MLRRLVSATLPILATAFLTLVAQTAAAQQDGQNAPKPQRKWVVYLLPHAHVDIGYTHVQTEVARIHRQILDVALELCRKTADYPPGAQFKWNTEVLWQVDAYLRQSSPEKQQQLVDAVRNGQVGLDAFYGNELTGLCRPEELLRLMQWKVSIGRRCGAHIDSAMITDVPGFTWGLVPAMAQAGVKYLSIGCNGSYRIGRVLQTWQDKPFYCLAPDGQHKILCWVPYKGYSYASSFGYKLAERLPVFLAELENRGYPYDIVQIRWTRGDNRLPEASLSDQVKDWNAKHDYPRVVIATTAEMFHDFENRYADKIPVVSGDFTPYWEDGATTSARETALNRTSAERLVQAETLAAMFDSHADSAGAFLEAWRNVLLYDEHTWGARQYNVTDYDMPFIVDQWKIKQAFALDGDRQSQKLLADALARRNTGQPTGGVDVFNTSSWPRTDLVLLSREASAAGDLVTAPDGTPVPSQRLSTGQLAFLAKDVPALAGRRYTIASGKPTADGKAKAQRTTLTTPSLLVRLDPASGTIESLRAPVVNTELCDTSRGVGLNRYFYVLGDRVDEAQQAATPKITVKESGPLVASLLVESDAPGCAKLTREVRVVDGLNRVDIVNTLDKKEVRQRESVHLGFAFNVPDGVMRINIPWAVFRPEIDQIPAACKEWLCVGRWADVSNDRYGVTWATVDAPMIEVGAMRTLFQGAEDPNLWIAKLQPSQTLYSYVMNNHWPTNYRAFQSGPTTFRYSLLPHQQYDQAAAQRFGIECSQPLVVASAQGAPPSDQPFLELDTPDVIVASIKPSQDRKALIVRLFAAAGRPATTTLHWARAPKSVWISDLAEQPLTAVTGPIELPKYAIVTLRAE